jgi:hypothetical protein
MAFRRSVPIQLFDAPPSPTIEPESPIGQDELCDKLRKQSVDGVDDKLLLELWSDVAKRGERAVDAEVARMDRIDRKAHMVLLAVAGAVTVLTLSGRESFGLLRTLALLAGVAGGLCSAIGLLSRTNDALGDGDWLSHRMWPHRTAAAEQYVVSLHRILHARRTVNNDKARWVRYGQYAAIAALVLSALTAWAYQSPVGN